MFLENPIANIGKIKKYNLSTYEQLLTTTYCLLMFITIFYMLPIYTYICIVNLFRLLF